MISQPLEENVIKIISRLLSVSENPHNIVYHVMMLSDSQYHFLFCQLSLELNIDINTIHALFTQISQRYLLIDNNHGSFTNPQKVETNQQQESQSNEQNDKSTQINYNKTTLSKFKHEFQLTLRTILQEYDQTANIMTDKQLCLCLATYFSVHSPNQFWERVHNAIPYKTVLQLKQYFQKSFSKCKFEEISDNDKCRIMEITLQMPQSKPSDIVDAFFIEIGNDAYFRREVLMLVQYFQRTKK
ncbi:Hypothetical_protein [Hexamita inflata]|uniref:Hypothetical_protein n=1 Tax=Hexamita inflata TaxID=28002 RepID=A0AA86PWW4_9EUKA|nr:Hypothetical protein HINF_LOCUS29589 [Hexamita inflata]